MLMYQRPWLLSGLPPSSSRSTPVMSVAVLGLWIDPSTKSGRPSAALPDALPAAMAMVPAAAVLALGRVEALLRPSRSTVKASP